MSVWERVWTLVPGSRPRRWRRGWTRKHGVNGTVGPAPGFTWAEVRSKDGVDPPRWMLPRIARQARALNELRNLVSRHHDAPRVTIKVSSWYRTAAHNAAVGGARNSYHVQGLATDIVVRAHLRNGRIVTVPPSVVAMLAERVPEFHDGGVGTYASFTHLDHRPYRARWSG